MKLPLYTSNLTEKMKRIPRVERHCRRCLIPDEFPTSKMGRVHLNEEGICTICIAYDKSEIAVPDKAVLKSEEEKFERFINKTKGKYLYDGLVMLSGGKDSTYLVKRLIEEYKLNLLAITIDKHFLPEVAKENINKITDKLNIDHIYYRYRKDFIISYYKDLLMRYVTDKNIDWNFFCMNCGTLYLDTCAKFALKLKIPLLFTGVDEMELPRELNFRLYKGLNSFAVERFGKFNRFRWTENDTKESKKLKLPLLIAPLFFWERNEKYIRDYIKDILSNQDTDVLSTNCDFIPLLFQLEYEKTGSIPYHEYISYLIRKGDADKNDYMDICEGKRFDESFYKRIESVLRKLGISEREIEKLLVKR